MNIIEKDVQSTIRVIQSEKSDLDYDYGVSIKLDQQSDKAKRYWQRVLFGALRRIDPRLDKDTHRTHRLMFLGRIVERSLKSSDDLYSNEIWALARSLNSELILEDLRLLWESTNSII